MTKSETKPAQMCACDPGMNVRRLEEVGDKTSMGRLPSKTLPKTTSQREQGEEEEAGIVCRGRPLLRRFYRLVGHVHAVSPVTEDHDALASVQGTVLELG